MLICGLESRRLSDHFETTYRKVLFGNRTFSGSYFRYIPVVLLGFPGESLIHMYVRVILAQVNAHGSLATVVLTGRRVKVPLRYELQRVSQHIV